MTKTKHNLFFAIFLFTCFVLIFSLEAPTRNYIPVIWGTLGFGLYGFLLFRTWMSLNKKLINEHKADLIRLNIKVYDNQFSKTIDGFAFLRNRKQIAEISGDIKLMLSYYWTFFRLTMLAFIMFAILGILTVVMTWL